MPQSNGMLFSFCVLVWGTTWIAITMQLGQVSPLVSVAYRFTIAAIILGLLCWARGIGFKMPARQHVQVMFLGLCLFCLDYGFLYSAQQYLVSAIVALMSSCIIYFNVLLRRVWLGKAVRLEVILGATLGMLGMALIFAPEFSAVEVKSELWWGIGLALCSFVAASVGNVVSEKVLDNGIPVMQMNFWAMSYSLIFLYGAAGFQDSTWQVPLSGHYIPSLLFLAVFGSVLAFGAYMKLVQQIGSDKSAYVVLMYPIVALLMSTLFEDYQWHWQAGIGVAIILLGNGIAMGKLRWPQGWLPQPRSG